MYCKIWNFTVESSKQEKFEEEYGRAGSWFKFFETCEDFLGLELMKNADGKTYMVIDRWMSEDDYEDYISDNQAVYDDLTDKNKELYSEQQSMGTFNILQ
ncbi:MAG: antibiotic biosynthesis monooxygenase [Ekhidna sp.]